jgi:hypothetical protein
VLFVGPGFWTGFAVSLGVLVADLIYLRRSAVRARRRRQAELRRDDWIAAQQAAVRLEHDRRQHVRREAVRRAAADREAARRDSARRAMDHVERYAPRPRGGLESGGLESGGDLYAPRATSATGTESLLGLRESLASQLDVGRGLDRDPRSRDRRAADRRADADHGVSVDPPGRSGRAGNRHGRRPRWSADPWS